MNRKILFWVAAILLLGIIFLAYSQRAQANRSTDESPSAEQLDRQSLAADVDDDECKDKKGKDKKKCKGTVKPPSRDIIIPVTGEYSVGGFCTLSVEFNDPTITLNATIETPLPGELPKDVQKIRQGCLLAYHLSNDPIGELPDGSVSTICFAAIPNQEMVLYFYDLDAPSPEWMPLETTTEAGISCAAANASGVYVATFKKP